MPVLQMPFSPELMDPILLRDELSPAAKAWRVLHAAAEVRPLLAIIECQLAAGMKPSVVTLEGLAEPEDYLKPHGRQNPVSLLFAWNEVRSWRKSLLEAEAAVQPRGFQVVHAHS